MSAPPSETLAALHRVLSFVKQSPGTYRMTMEASASEDAALLQALRDGLTSPFCWTIPGDNGGRSNGAVDAMLWTEGEFTKPLYDLGNLK